MFLNTLLEVRLGAGLHFELTQSDTMKCYRTKQTYNGARPLLLTYSKSFFRGNNRQNVWLLINDIPFSVALVGTVTGSGHIPELTDNLFSWEKIVENLALEQASRHLQDVLSEHQIMKSGMPEPEFEGQDDWAPSVFRKIACIEKSQLATIIDFISRLPEQSEEGTFIHEAACLRNEGYVKVEFEN